MIPEIDQSVKIENTSADTALALSNNINYAVLIPASVKRNCIRSMREGNQRGTSAVLRVFSAALFLLLEKHLKRIEQIVIDTEYPGHEGKIKSMLLNWIRKRRPDFSPANIIFARVGKRSPARKKAINITRRKEKPDRVLTAVEILALLGK